MCYKYYKNINQVWIRLKKPNLQLKFNSSIKNDSSSLSKHRVGFRLSRANPSKLYPQVGSFYLNLGNLILKWLAEEER